MLPPTTTVYDDVRPETETKTKNVVSHAKELWMLCLRSVDKEELLYGTKPLLFALVHDQEVLLNPVLLQPRRRRGG